MPTARPDTYSIATGASLLAGGSASSAVALGYDRATPQQISFRCPLTLADATVATATAEYKTSGAPTWIDAGPLYRIKAADLGSLPDDLVGKVGNSYVGWITGLAPGTTYDVRVRLTIAGQAEQIVHGTRATRALPAAAPAFNKTCTPGTFAAQLATLVPGDHLRLGAGTYTLSATLGSVPGGTLAQPIYITAAAIGDVTFARATGTALAPNSDYVVWERVRFTGSSSDSGTAVLSQFCVPNTGRRNVGWTFRYCEITGFDAAFKCFEPVDDFLVYECLIRGNNTWDQTYYVPPGEEYPRLTWDDSGLQFPGSGNAVWSNTISGFGDAFRCHTSAGLRFTAGNYYWRNHIEWNGDNAFEADDAAGNVAAYDNLITNSGDMLSVDGTYGPTGFFRNICINTTRGPIKVTSLSRGSRIESNTWVITAKSATSAHGLLTPGATGQHGLTFRNNLFVYSGPGNLVHWSSPMYGETWGNNAWTDGAVFINGTGSYANIAAAKVGNPARFASDVVVPAQPFAAAITMGADYATQVPSPTVSGLQLIASDGLSVSQPISNNWGLHQGRITVHNGGVVRVLYLRPGASGQASWRVMRRATSAGAWVEEATGLSHDDVHLLRDPVSDLAYVVSWPASLLTVTTLPGGVASVVPGDWEVLSVASRHYYASGVAEDGRLWIKTSVELPTATPTDTTQTRIVAGQYTVGVGWSWSAQLVESTGLRCGYDHLMPSAGGLVATAQLNLYKTAAGFPSSGNNYVFNGISLYRAASIQAAVVRQLLVNPVTASASVVLPPTLRQQDGYIDRSGQLLCTYYLEDVATPANSGIYMVATSTAGVPIFSGKLAVPTYGYTRVFDDPTGQRWLLWTNLGTQMTQVVLHRINQNGAGVSLSGATDLSAALSPYAIQGGPFLAVPRGGQSVGTKISCLVIAGERQFISGALDPTPPALSPGGQKVLQFEINLSGLTGAAAALAVSSPARNAGALIPGVTDGHSGATPDIGAVITGRAAVTYGRSEADTSPQWLAALAAGTWGTVPASNTASSIDPAGDPASNPNHPGAPPWATSQNGALSASGGFSRTMTAWCGACFDSVGGNAHFNAPGGHTDYFGNASYRLKLNRSVPVWERYSNPSILPTYSGGEATGRYSDGRARSSHTYMAPVYVPGLGPVLSNQQAMATAGIPGAGEVVSFNETTGAETFWAASTAGGGAGSSSCYDSDLGVVWHRPHGSHAMRKWSHLATPQHTIVGGVITWNGGCSMVHMTGLGCVLLGNGEDSIAGPRVPSQSQIGGWAVFDTATGTLHSPTFTGAPTTINQPTLGVWPGAAQPMWDAARRCAYVWDKRANTTQIVRLTPGANPRTDPWVVDTIPVSGSNTVTPTVAQIEGTYGRAWFWRDCVFVVNAVDQPVYFFKVA